MPSVAALLKENAELREQVASLVGQVAALTEQLAKMNDRVGELLAIAQRKQRKATEPKPPLPPPAVSDDQAKAFQERPQAPAKPSTAKREKKKVSPTGRKPLPSHLEAEEHELRPHACAHCGGLKLDIVDELVEEKLHVVKEHQRRRRVRRKTCRCRDCGGRTTPRSLPAPYERSKVTSEWLAWLTHSKFALLAPLDRIRRDLAERGVPLAMSTLVTFIERAADILAPIDGLHWKQLLASSWMATDGTGLKVLIPKLPKAHSGYIELYRNNETAVFQYSPDKAGEGVIEKLRVPDHVDHRFRGKPITDSGPKPITDSDGCRSSIPEHADR